MPGRSTPFGRRKPRCGDGSSKPTYTYVIRLDNNVHCLVSWKKGKKLGSVGAMGNDPLLQPFQLKHLTLRNRIITTSHEPAYAEDGLPKERYRAYHLERAKGGVALTMTAASASVASDSPPRFTNLLLYKDEVVPWLRD